MHHRMYVRNTFLDVEVHDVLDMGRSHRCFFNSFSEPSSPRGDRPAVPELELTTIENLNKILDGASLRALDQEDAPSAQELPEPETSSEPELATASLKPSRSSMSVSTMDTDEGECEGTASEGTQGAPTPLRYVSSSISVASMASSSWDSEFTLSQDSVATAQELQAPRPQLQQVQAGKRQRRRRGASGDQAAAAAAAAAAAPQLSGAAPPSQEFTHNRVPKSSNLAEKFSSDAPQEAPTTMMVRNIPNRYSQRELIEELEALGFAGSFDFLYAPTDFGTMGNVGYTFINFITPEWAERCRLELEGYLFSKHQKKTGKKVATVSVAHLQGLQANLRHYEKSAVAVRARSKGCGPVVMASLCQCM